MNEEETSKSFNRFWTIWNLIEACVLFGSGILAIVLASINKDNTDSNIESLVAYAIGAFILLDGSLRIIMSFCHYKGTKSSDESAMLIGGFELSIGITMVLLETHFYNSTKEHIITFLIANFVAILLIIIGLLLIIFSTITIIKKYEKPFMPILEILFSAILIGVGITIIILYYKSNNSNIVLILTGSILSIAGISQGVITLLTKRKNKKKETLDNKNSKKIKKENTPKELYNVDDSKVIEVKEIDEQSKEK